MRVGVLSILAAVMLISLGASAAISDLPNTTTITVEVSDQGSEAQSPFELTFYVQNSKNTKSPLAVSANIPTPYEIQAPGWVNPNSRQKVTVQIFGKPGFENTTYNGTIFIDLSGEKEQKDLEIIYVGTGGTNEPQEQDGNETVSGIFSGFASVLQGGADSQTITDIFLMIVAAILLIAFIARLVRAATERE